jgi:hypothetical protein
MFTYKVKEVKEMEMDDSLCTHQAAKNEKFLQRGGKKTRMDK